MRKRKRWLSLLLVLLLLLIFQRNVYLANDSLYEKMLQAYHNGQQMDDWVVEARKQIAAELELSEYLDERAFLSVDYRNANSIGRYGDITDQKLNLLVEMATDEEVEAVLQRSILQTLDVRSITSGQTVDVTQKARVSGAGNGYYAVDGAVSYGYCAQNSRDFWANNQTKYGIAYEWDNATVRKALYYAPGGPGYAGPYYGSMGADMDYATFAIGKLNGDCRNNTKATTYINFVSSKSDPLSLGYKAYKADITPDTYQDVAFLAYDQLKGYLWLNKTSTHKISGSNTSYYSLDEAEYGVFSDSACTERVGTLTTDTSGSGSTGGSYENGNTNALYLDAGTYYVKEVTAPKGYMLNTTVYTAVVSSGQTKIIYTQDRPYGLARICKISANSELTEGNSCYSLEGAEYTIYSDEACTRVVKTLKTDENGNTPLTYIDAGLQDVNYWVKETVAPKGYALDSKTYVLTMKAGEITTLNVADNPQLSPVDILLGKVNAETNADQLEKSPPLKGAQFTIKYYGALLEDMAVDPATQGHTPIRTWVFETDEDGFCAFLEDYLVSGDKFYYSSSGAPSMPIGTITIQETKAPEGYLIHSEMFIRQITTYGTLEELDTYNHPVIPEQTLNLNLSKKQQGTEIAISGSRFEHTKPDGTTEVLTTDSNGQLSFVGLTYGNHMVREIYAPDGYVLNGNVIAFHVAADNKITLTSKFDNGKGNIHFEVTEEGNISLDVYDKLAPYSIMVHKHNEKGVKLHGAEFAMYSDRNCTDEVTRGVTDADGILKFTGLEIGTKYYLREEKAPDGYRIPVDDNGNPFVTEIYASSLPVQNEFSFYVNGSEYDASSVGAFTLSGAKRDRLVNLIVVNEVGQKLPDTGSNTMIPLVISGIVFFLFGISKGRRMYVKFVNDKKK